MAEYLKSDGLMELYRSKPGSLVLKLTGKGLDFQRTGRSYSEHFDEQKRKFDRDSLHKDLQIQDLEMKLEVMNKEQLKFWHRQRWQFWLTLMIAGAAFILSVIDFIKGMIIN